MSEEKKVESIEDRLTAFIHESYGLALAALGLSPDQIKEAATTVDDSLTNNFDCERPATFRFATESGSDEEYVEATSLEEAALSIASRNGWYYEPESDDEEEGEAA